MRNMKAKVVLATLVAVAAMIGLGATFPGGTLTKVHAQEEVLEACSAATLNGTYALTFSGFTTRGAINNFTPVAGGGLVTFDGDGNLSASETVSVGGLVNPVNTTGTYTVNSDCTGTFTGTDPGNVVLDNFIKR